VEKDRELIKILQEEIPPNVEIVNDYILKYKIPAFVTLRRGKQNTEYKLLASLPYAIVGPVLKKFLEAKHKPELMVLMVQKRSCAENLCKTSQDKSLGCFCSSVCNSQNYKPYIKTCILAPAAR